MIKKAHSLLLIGFFALCSLNLSATHIVGGNLNYTYLGKNQYELRLEIYRDCIGILFDGDKNDNPPKPGKSPSPLDGAVIGIFGSDNILIQDELLIYNPETPLPPAVYDDCTTPPAINCYNGTVYTKTVTLPPRAGGYTLYYQRCCRNSKIVNIIDPLCTGTTYAAFIPGPEIVQINSNPVITKWPESTICSKKLWTFDSRATDKDDDSLVYEMFHPYAGLNFDCGAIRGGKYPLTRPACAPPTEPVNCMDFAVSQPQPFVKVEYKSPYSFNDMLGGDLPLQIDKYTGKVTAKPGIPGTYVVGWKVKEYRNGKLISETLRDFQLIVVDCVADLVASAVAPIAICSSNEVAFKNNSTGSSALDYKWDFGDQVKTDDVSTDKEPKYTYPAKGTYTVNLKVSLKAKPQCTAEATSVVTLTEGFKSDFTYNTVPCSDEYIFTGNAPSVPGGKIAWEWDFGDGSPKQTISNPRHTFNGTGPFPVKVTTKLIPDDITREIKGCSFEGTTTPVTPGPPPKLYIPNTFTPNKDGVNDLFMPRGVNYKIYYFQVRSRIGELMFETTDPNAGWDGWFKGRPCDPGVYGWFTKMKCDENSPEIFKKGNVTLIR